MVRTRPSWLATVIFCLPACINDAGARTASASEAATMTTAPIPSGSSGKALATPLLPKDHPALAGLRLKPLWQRRFLGMLATSDSDGYALFSEGGWTDNGQVLVFVTEGGRSGRLVLASPNQAGDDGSPVTESALSAGEIASFSKSLTGVDELIDLAPTAFDALTYEMVHARGDGHGGVKVLRRVLYRNLNGRSSPRHDAIIAAFRGLSEGR